MATTEFRFEAVGTNDLVDTDLAMHLQAAGDEARGYRITIEGHAETAEAVHDLAEGRTGIAWGADASWADSTGDVEADIRMYLDNPETWEQRN